jgi:hypothetical protein
VRVVGNLRSEHEVVTEAALFAITYEPWDEYVGPVRELVASGVGGQVGETAQDLLRQFEADAARTADEAGTE